jgi:hypothetical protein
MVKDHVQTAAVGGSMYWRKVKGLGWRKLNQKIHYESSKKQVGF